MKLKTLFSLVRLALSVLLVCHLVALENAVTQVLFKAQHSDESQVLDLKAASKQNRKVRLAKIWC